MLVMGLPFKPDSPASHHPVTRRGGLTADAISAQPHGCGHRASLVVVADQLQRGIRWPDEQPQVKSREVVYDVVV